jgi:SET domain-containing protein
MKINELDLKIKPSKVEGVGVFSTRPIPKGSKLYWDKKVRKISQKEAKKNKILFEFCERYCLETNDGYHCPLNFLSMSIIWFLNHSKNPNLTKSTSYWVTNQDIKKDEELTIDYDDLDTKVSNSEYMGEKLK